MFKNLWMTLKVVKMAWKKMRTLDDTLVKRFSPAWWCRFRMWCERIALELWQKRNAGWLGFIKADDAWFFGFLLFLKSDALYKIYKAKDTTDAQRKAINNLMGKDPDRSYTKLVEAYACH